jgi:tripartite-type tricarboxylate transporter receptor subunit TctC
MEIIFVGFHNFNFKGKGAVMRKKILFYLIIFSLAFPLALTVDAKPFYQGKVMKLICTSSPGGGNDFYARLMAKFMKKYLPGSTIIVKNKPGGGSIIGVNELYRAKPDGLTIGNFNRAVGIAQIVGLKGVKFDFQKLSWLGSATSELYSLMARSDKYKNIDDFLKADYVRVATDGMGSLSYLTTLLFYQSLGKKNYKASLGYGSREVDMAVVRREMDATFGSFYSSVGMVNDGHANVLMFIGNAKPAGYEKVPFIQEVIPDKKHKPVIDLLVGINVMGRPFAGPAGIPKDRLEILRQAFKKTLQDPEVLELAKRAGRPISYISYKDAEDWAKGLFNLPPGVVNTTKQAYGAK